MTKRKSAIGRPAKKRCTNLRNPEEGNLGSTETNIPVCTEGSNTEGEQSLEIVPERAVQCVMRHVGSLGHRVGSSAWLNDPNINAGASTSRAFIDPDVPANVDQEISVQLQESPNVVSDNTDMPEEVTFVRPKRVPKTSNWVRRKQRRAPHEGDLNEIQPIPLETDGENIVSPVSRSNAEILPAIETDGEDIIIPISRNDGDTVELRNFIYPVAWCAVDEIATDIDTHLCGEFNIICIHCNAIYFRGECNSRKKYVHCCNLGKVVVPPLGSYPTLLRDLMEGRHPDAKNFLRYIRKYNNMLSFTSVEVATDIPAGRGPYTYRIHGVMYHRISNSMRPPSNVRPRFAQLFVYDAEEALRERMNLDVNRDLKESLLRQLDHLFRDNNPFAQSFKLMREVEQEVLERDGPDAVKNIRMWFQESRPTMGIHQGQLNAPVATDVAMIYRSTTDAPPTGSFCIYPVGGGLQNISREHRFCDPLTYAIFFPNGESGWDRDMNFTLLRFYSYRFAFRENDLNVILRGRRLLQQYIVDAYCAVEANRLRYVRLNQKQMRVESYTGLMDHIQNMSVQADLRAGLPIILPSTFIGGARNMQQKFQDAMAIVREFGKPDLFVTFTCNPNWPEIKTNLLTGQSASDRPDLVARVFDLKKKALLEDIVKTEIFGKVLAYIYVIEFQKRGLPHMHLLLILHQNNKIRNAEDVDKIVSAEIPNKNINKKLFDIVVSHMVHGPCGQLNPNCPCMVDGKCSKQYPKSFCEVTSVNDNAYPLYKRPDNGRYYNKGNAVIDNRHIVPYNPYLLMKYDAHINVEMCSSLRSVKYIYKYVYKGHDMASITFNDSNTGILQWDEIRAFQNSRYISAPEAIWRLFEKPLDDRSHSLTRLPVHLENMQPVFFINNNEVEALDRAATRDTQLTGFFKLNELDADAREYLYTEIPKQYVWDKRTCTWKRRQRGHDRSITRMYSVSVRDIERYHLRILLSHVRGPKSFKDIRTYNGVLYNSFKDACIAKNLLQNDREWYNTIEEAITFEMPKKLRQLFAFICVFCSPANPLELWEEFRFDLSEDYIRHFNNEVQGYQKALADIATILAIHKHSLEDMGLPPIDPNLLDNDADIYDPIEEDRQYQRIHDKLNVQQKKFFDDVMAELNGITSIGKCFHLDAFAGAGKSFVLNAILNKVRGNGVVAIAVAWSGIAAMLLKGGTTVHTRFKVPLNLTETSVCNIRPNSPEGLYIKSAQIIVWDECTMTHKFGFEAVDRVLRDITGINKPFGDKIIIMSGDWRQILPVVNYGNRLSTVEACVKNSYLWTNFRRYTLVHNMRTNPSEIQFSEWLLKLGDGKLSNTYGLGDNIIEIPNVNIASNNLILDIYGENINDIAEEDLINTAILSSKNDTVLELNENILTKLSGDVHTYYSADNFECEDTEEADMYPMEFVHSVTPSGMPPHQLNLKVGAVIMLLRNLNIIGGLCNGTRLIVRRLMANVIDAEIAVGAQKGERVFIPRIELSPSDNKLPFKLIRRQFPVRLCFAMTINKAQGQSLRKIGILLKEPVFTHGMLYVAFSRATRRDSVHVYVTESNKQGKLIAGQNNVFTPNVVFTEILS